MIFLLFRSYLLPLTHSVIFFIIFNADTSCICVRRRMHLYLKVIDMHQRISDFPLTRPNSHDTFEYLLCSCYVLDMLTVPFVLHDAFILNHSASAQVFSIRSTRWEKKIDSSLPSIRVQTVNSLTYARSNQIHRINSTLFYFFHRFFLFIILLMQCSPSNELDMHFSAHATEQIRER